MLASSPGVFLPRKENKNRTLRIVSCGGWMPKERLSLEKGHSVMR